MLRRTRRITCDNTELPSSRSLSSRVQVRHSQPDSVKTEHELAITELPPEVLNVIFVMLSPIARHNFALTCHLFNSVRNDHTTILQLHSMDQNVGFYRRLLAYRPRLSKIVLAALHGRLPCRNVDTAIQAMQTIDKDVNLELCDCYAIEMAAHLFDVLRGRNFTVQSVEKVHAELPILRIGMSPVFFCLSRPRNEDRFFANSVITRLEYGQALSMAAKGDIKGLAEKVGWRSLLATHLQVAPLNCSGIRRQTTPMRLTPDKKSRMTKRVPSSKRIRRQEAGHCDGDDDAMELTAENETDDDDDDSTSDVSDDDNGDEHQNDHIRAFWDTIFPGDCPLVHCDCGRCPRVLADAKYVEREPFDVLQDPISPKCECVAGLVSINTWPLRCMCEDGILSLDNLMWLAKAAIIRPAVCRQPIYRRLAFYPLVQAMQVNSSKI